MKKTAWAALALMPVLAACSSNKPAEQKATGAPTSVPTSAPSSDGGRADLKAACEKFNELTGKLRAMSYPDRSGYLDLYTESRSASDAAAGETKKAILAIGLLALDFTESDTIPAEDQARMTQEWRSIAGPCEAAGVTPEL